MLWLIKMNMIGGNKMTIIGRRKVRCHNKVKTVDIHKGEHGGKYFMARNKGGKGTHRKYI